MKRLALLFLSLFCSALASPALAGVWGCYDPKPGHPTADERNSFIAEVSPLAVKAERDHGVPAAAIAAMSMVESGYGWTRTALDAQNLFGWKFTGSSAAGGRTAYTLTCQPPEDINNRYILFRNHADAMDFVASKLATLNYYKADTAAYVSAKASGGDVQSAVKAWVKGISDPYNWKPEEYTRNVTRIMNDPVSPSDTAAANNLYRLSETARQDSAAPVATAEAATPANDPDLAYASGKVTIWHSSCDAPILNYPRWEGFPVTLCAYRDVGATVHTYVLNADRAKLAKWVVTACRDAQATQMHACIDDIAAITLNAASGNIFPVAGYVPEPATGGAACYLFRDGVTVWTGTFQWPPTRNGTCAPDAPNQNVDETVAPITRVWKYARIASATRDDYRAAGGQEAVGKSGDSNSKWLDVARTLYQQAWNGDRNELISMVAKREKRNGKFR